VSAGRFNELGDRCEVSRKRERRTPNTKRQRKGKVVAACTAAKDGARREKPNVGVIGVGSQFSRSHLKTED